MVYEFSQVAVSVKVTASGVRPDRGEPEKSREQDVTVGRGVTGLGAVAGT